MQLFGFTITRDDIKDTQPSFAPPKVDDGAILISILMVRQKMKVS
jgi:hypothetical protein